MSIELCGTDVTPRHLQQRFLEHIGSKGILKKHFEECDIYPSENLVMIINRKEKLLEEPHTKDEYRSRTLKF